MLKSFWFWFVIFFIAIQLIPMNVPAQMEHNPKSEIVAPKEVMTVLKRSCYDCHSSEIVAPWYYNIAPIAWFTKIHVRNARKVVNFSNWNEYDNDKQLKVIEKLPKAIVIRMPLTSYLYMHEEAKLTKEEKKLLTKWARDLKEELK
jgi:hypothetical protein